MSKSMLAAKRSYVVSGLAFLAASFWLITVRIIFASGLFDAADDVTVDVVGSILVQIVGILGAALIFHLINELRFPKDDINLNNVNFQEELSTKQKIANAFKDIGFRLPAGYVWPLSILTGILFIIFTMGVSYISIIILAMTGYNLPTSSDVEQATVGLFLLSLFLSAVLPAICEEILHRGVIVKGLKGVYDTKNVIIFSALFFSLGHANIMQTLYTFAGGVVLATIAVKTKSIYPSMIIHFMNNALYSYLDYARAGGWPGAELYDNTMEYIFSNLALAFFIWVAASGLLLFILKYISKTEDKKERDSNVIRYDAENKPVMPASYPYMAAYEPKYQPTLLERVPMYSAIFLAGLITIFTFIWGLF